jgi:plastocyanin
MHLKISILIALAMAVVLLFGPTGTQAGGGCHNGAFSDERGTQVELSANCFEPTVVRVQPGEQVTWTSGDTEEDHTVTGAANRWDTGKIHMGESVSYQFDEAGVFPYFCAFHPSMVGAVVVGDGEPAASSGGSDGVKAVSAQAPGGEDATADEAKSAESGDGGTDELLIAGIALAVMVAVTGAALVLQRKAAA